MTKMIMSLNLLASLFILVSCIKSQYQPHEVETPGMECPARLMTDADQLWICAYFIEENAMELDDDQSPPSFDCILMECYTVNHRDTVCQIKESGRKHLFGVAHVEAETTEFLCV